MRGFENSRVLVTGAGSGIGLELVRLLYPFTKRILAVDVSEENMRSLQSKFAELEGFIITDLSQKEGNHKILDWVKAHWYNLDYCFANAGKAEYQAAPNQNWKEMDLLFQLNVFSPIQLGMELKEHFPNSSFQHVITCSAMAFWAVPGYSLYASSKSALLQWAESAWSEKSGDWLSLAFPIATSTGFFAAAGNQIPRAFPAQKPELVANKILLGAQKRKRKIFPSRLFKILLFLDRFFFLIRPIYQSMENRKLKKWLFKQTTN